MTELQAGLLEIMKDAGDLIAALGARSDIVFDKKLWPLVQKLGETGRKCRGLLPPHNLWDLTNDPERAASIRRVLAPSDSELGEE